MWTFYTHTSSDDGIHKNHLGSHRHLYLNMVGDFILFCGSSWLSMDKTTSFANTAQPTVGWAEGYIN